MSASSGPHRGSAQFIRAAFASRYPTTPSRTTGRRDLSVRGLLAAADVRPGGSVKRRASAVGEVEDNDVLLWIPLANEANVEEAFAAGGAAQPPCSGGWPAIWAAGLRGAIAIMEPRRAEIVDSFVHESGSTRLKVELEWDMARTATLELESDCSLVVLADAELDLAVRGAVLGKFLRQGQICTAIKRLIVDAAIYDDLIERFKVRDTTLKYGNPSGLVSAVGPLINGQQLQRLLDTSSGSEGQATDHDQPLDHKGEITMAQGNNRNQQRQGQGGNQQKQRGDQNQSETRQLKGSQGRDSQQNEGGASNRRGQNNQSDDNDDQKEGGQKSGSDESNSGHRRNR